jgi:hypothetical protein
MSSETLTKSWWLLALCGVLDAALAALNLFMFAWDGSPAWRTFAIRGAALLMSRIALAAGLCTIAAGIWSFGKGRSWLLVLNGLAFSAYGLIPRLWRGPLSFLLFARLLIVMAISIGIFEMLTARNLGRQRHVTDGWFLGLAGVASFGFALAFLALTLNWIQLESRPLHASLFLWLVSYFGFSAICMAGLALHLQNRQETPAAIIDRLLLLRWPTLVGHRHVALQVDDARVPIGVFGFDEDG